MKSKIRCKETLRVLLSSFTSAVCFPEVFRTYWSINTFLLGEKYTLNAKFRDTSGVALTGRLGSLSTTPSHCTGGENTHMALRIIFPGDFTCHLQSWLINELGGRLFNWISDWKLGADVFSDTNNREVLHQQLHPRQNTLCAQFTHSHTAHISLQMHM